MNKLEFIKELSEKTGVSKKEVESVYDSILEYVESGMVNNKECTLLGIGRLFIVDKPSRTGVNPKTGEKIEIAPRSVIKIKAYKCLTNKVLK